MTIEELLIKCNEIADKYDYNHASVHVEQGMTWENETKPPQYKAWVHPIDTKSKLKMVSTENCKSPEEVLHQLKTFLKATTKKFKSKTVQI